MKLFVVLLVLCITLAVQAGGNGRPGCKTQAELEVKNFRNIWDPTAYWKCETLGQPGKKVRCPDARGWLDSKKKCVKWDEWDWEEPEDPPSEP